MKLYEAAPSTERRRAAEAAAADYVAYVRTLIAYRRREPGDDLLSDLIATRDADGSRLSEDELVATAVLLQMAGHEASVNVVGNGTHALLTHPGELARLRADPGLVPSAVEELIRYDSPLQLFERTATVPVPIGPVTVEPGQRIAALLGAANRDPAAFADPDRLDLGRSPTRTWASAPASTSASAPRWPGSSCRRRWPRSSPTCRDWPRPGSRPGIRPSPTAAWPRSR